MCFLRFDSRFLLGEAFAAAKMLPLLLIVLLGMAGCARSESVQKGEYRSQEFLPCNFPPRLPVKGRRVGRECFSGYAALLLASLPPVANSGAPHLPMCVPDTTMPPKSVTPCAVRGHFWILQIRWP